MLTNDAMGMLALAILWVNTLLITAAAGKELRALVRLLGCIKPLGPGETGPGMVEGKIVRANGPDGALGCHRVEQIGRQGNTRGERLTILFADRSQKGEVFGGAIALEREASELLVPAAAEAEVWLHRDALQEAGACPSMETLDEAHEQARKARGYTRTVTAPVGVGARVWVAGTLEQAGAQWKLKPATSDPPGDGPIHGGLLVATLDPRRFCHRKIALATSFIAAIPAIAAACTALALHPPYFGTISTVGGALCLAFFLLVQPAGTALRDAVKPPSRAELRGAWSRDAAR